uniref:Uncharacterized protein n=1 Tax=Leersia perrieri TaxID=77586 RepID=A0A0D9WEE6_9ORYZ
MVSLGVIAGEHRRRFVGDFAGGFSVITGERDSAEIFACGFVCVGGKFVGCSPSPVPLPFPIREMLVATGSMQRKGKTAALTVLVMCNNYRESKCKSIEVEEIVCLIRCFKLHTNMRFWTGFLSPDV